MRPETNKKTNKMLRDEAYKIVLGTGWLSGMPDAFSRALLSRCRVVSYKKGRVIFSTGDPGGGLYGLIRGLARVEYLVPSVGSQTCHLGHPGQWIGATSALRGAPREVTLVANTDSELFYLPPAAFDDIAQNPQQIRAFAELIAENQAVIMSAVRDLLKPNVTERIAGRLLAAVDWYPGGKAREIEVTQSELAMICNVSRKTINKELGRLSDMGLVSLAYGRFTVVDPAALDRIAGQSVQSQPQTAPAKPRVRIQGSPLP